MIQSSGDNYGIGSELWCFRDVMIKPIIEIFNSKEMTGYARNCGWALAMAHARSADTAVIAGYLGKNDIFTNALVDFAATYSEINAADYNLLLEAVASVRSRLKLTVEALIHVTSELVFIITHSQGSLTTMMPAVSGAVI